MDEDLKILEERLFNFNLNKKIGGKMSEEVIRENEALEHLIQAYKQQADIIKNSVSKDKIKDILNNKFVVFYEGDAEFPDNATKINKVKYINAKHLQELLEGDE